MTTFARASRCAPLFAVSFAGMIAVGAAGCSSSTSGGATSGSGATGATGAQCKAGAEAAYANPAGTPFTLPLGVTVEGDIGADVSGDTKPHCRNAEDVEYASDLVLGCVGLRNSGAAPVVVTLPAGLVFVAKTADAMNGMLVHSHDLTVPAGLSYFAFRPASLNRACNYSVVTDHYAFGNVTNDPKLVEILTLAKTKKVNGDVGAAAVGRMIWDVTDDNGITDEHRMQLAAAPDL